MVAMHIPIRLTAFPARNLSLWGWSLSMVSKHRVPHGHHPPPPARTPLVSGVGSFVCVANMVVQTLSLQRWCPWLRNLSSWSSSTHCVNTVMWASSAWIISPSLTQLWVLAVCRCCAADCWSLASRPTLRYHTWGRHTRCVSGGASHQWCFWNDCSRSQETRIPTEIFKIGGAGLRTVFNGPLVSDKWLSYTCSQLRWAFLVSWEAINSPASDFSTCALPLPAQLQGIGVAVNAISSVLHVVHGCRQVSAMASFIMIAVRWSAAVRVVPKFFEQWKRQTRCPYSCSTPRKRKAHRSRERKRSEQRSRVMPFQDRHERDQKEGWMRAENEERARAARTSEIIWVSQLDERSKRRSDRSERKCNSKSTTNEKTVANVHLRQQQTPFA